MKNAVYSLLAAASIACASVADKGPLAARQQDDCNQDDCLLAINGTDKGPLWPETGSSDCNNYWTTTETLSTAFVTTNATTTLILTEFIPVPTAMRRVVRQDPAVTSVTEMPPRTTPAYASACEGLERYSSGCSCIGVTAAVVTEISPNASTSFITASEYKTITVYLNGSTVDAGNLTLSTGANSLAPTTLNISSISSISSTSTITPTATACSSRPGHALCTVPGGNFTSRVCVDLTSDSNNCGECGSYCIETQTCRLSTCVDKYIPPSTCSTPSTCGSTGFTSTCGPSSSSSGSDACVCASTSPDSPVAGICVARNTPCRVLPSCSRSADCGPNAVCAVNSCCGRNVCIGTEARCVAGVDPNGTFGGGDAVAEREERERRRRVLLGMADLRGELTFGG